MRRRAIVVSHALLTFAIVGALCGCGEAPVRVPETTGWGASSSRAPGASELYPAKYPHLDRATVAAREAQLGRELPGFRVSLALSGFFAQAEKTDDASPNELSLTPSEIALAQRFVDAHLDVFGLARPERLRRWHDGLYYISPADDPRYGIVLLRRGQRLRLAGHVWPGFTMRSSARKPPRELLAPWLGRRFRHEAAAPMPCDPVHDDPSLDCPAPDEAKTTTVTVDDADYVVIARVAGNETEVREVLALPTSEGSVLLEPEKGPIPASVDARTGEPIDAAGLGPGMCEEDGPCFLWGWINDPGHLDFEVTRAPSRRPMR